MSASPRSDGVDLSPVTVQILLSLVTGPSHGYGIKLDVEERTEGVMSLGSGTLYQALARLEEQELIEISEPPPGAAADARRGRFYGLTELGREALEAELANMERTLTSAAARAVLGARGEP